MATVEEIRKARTQKLQRLQKAGMLAYPGAVKRTHTLLQALENFGSLANPAEEKISSESPLGRALLGKKKGDKVQVQTPQAKTIYKILSIS